MKMKMEKYYWLFLVPFFMFSVAFLQLATAGVQKAESEVTSEDVISHSNFLLQRFETLFLNGNDSDVTVRVESVNSDEQKRFETLFLNGNGSDVTVRVESVNSDEVKVYQVHSLVVCLQSDVFRDLIEASKNRNSSSSSSSTSTSISDPDPNYPSSPPRSSLLLKESSQCAAVFHKFLRYLYNGELSLRVEEAKYFHQLATEFRVSSLQEGVTQFMTQNMARDTPTGHVAGWYEYALLSGDTTLRDSCLQFMSWNFSSLINSEEWPSASSHLVLTLLQRNDLVLQSEMELFSAVERWIVQNKPDGLTAENSLRAVRFAMMPPRELFRIQTQSSILDKYQESVRDLLYLSYQFHSASPLSMAKFFDVNCSLFVPRNYLSSPWGQAWIIPNPGRDDRSSSFQTQLGPSGHDSSKRVTWNALFSPRWLPLSMRSLYTESGSMMQPSRVEVGGGRPRVIVTPATSSADFAGVTFQKTVLVMSQPRAGRPLVVKHMYNFHQSTEENGDFLSEADLYKKHNNEYLIDGALCLHVIVKPLYQTLIATKN